MIQTVLFDLDGTFADTAPDLADALNRTLEKHNKPRMAYELIRPVVSHGGRALIELGFGITETSPEFEELRQDLLAFYKDEIAQHTQLFPGVSELIAALSQKNMCWGIVTNKPSWLTDPLMNSLRVDHQACCIVSGDTLAEKKPHPAPLLFASSKCNSRVQNCLYIGDAERDIIAGNRAGMLTMVALYGYIGKNDNPSNWQADSYVHSPQEILPWIESYNEQAKQNHDTAY
jgi:phosphoglycolate phosphatase